MLMTHVTHPFVTHSVFNELIHAWRGAAHRGHDSLLTVTKLHTFLWDAAGRPFNYDSSVEKWPRSQDIEPLFEINHVAYLIPFQKVLEVGDRVGESPICMRWRVRQSWTSTGRTSSPCCRTSLWPRSTAGMNFFRRSDVA